MVFTLETIVEKFGEEMAPFAVGLCQHLTQAFWRLQVWLCCPFVGQQARYLDLPGARSRFVPFPAIKGPYLLCASL